VTAERWVPIEEVKEAALLSWLAAKQAQGWVAQLQNTFNCRMLAFDLKIIGAAIHNRRQRWNG
jgi:hypothetical protein